MKPTDTLFILCKDPACFPEHPLTAEGEMAERVRMCRYLKAHGVRVNWD